jgi:hypothetical protein
MYLSSKLVEMDRSSLRIEVEEGLGRRSAIAEAILWAERTRDRKRNVRDKLPATSKL